MEPKVDYRIGNLSAAGLIGFAALIDGAQVLLFGLSGGMGLLGVSLGAVGTLISSALAAGAAGGIAAILGAAVAVPAAIASGVVAILGGGVTLGYGMLVMVIGMFIPWILSFFAVIILFLLLAHLKIITIGGMSGMTYAGLASMMMDLTVSGIPFMTPALIMIVLGSRSEDRKKSGTSSQTSKWSPASAFSAPMPFANNPHQ
jgi:hypothetical protein